MKTALSIRILNATTVFAIDDILRFFVHKSPSTRETEEIVFSCPSTEEKMCVVKFGRLLAAF